MLQTRLREGEAQIRRLKERMRTLELVDPEDFRGLETIRFGAQVSVSDEASEEFSYTIVGVDEADAKHGRISWISPLAKALLGHERTLVSAVGATARTLKNARRIAAHTAGEDGRHPLEMIWSHHAPRAPAPQAPAGDKAGPAENAGFVSRIGGFKSD